jgi:hypothetical protein
MIKMIKKNAEKNAENFYCQKCDFKCFKMSDWNRHIIRRKHMDDKNDKFFGENDNEKTPNLLKPEYVCECGRVYKYQSGLSRHKKTLDCQYKKYCDDESNNKIDESEIKMLTNLVLEVVKQNKELVFQNNETHKQNQELTNKIVEICKAGTTNNTQINNTNNNTFNLNVFLNEKCKDAMNIMDFVDSLQLQLSDLEDVGKLGFVEGISNIIVKNLKALDITERPIHCADKKREIIYVKDEDKWEKESDQKLKIRKAIKRVATKNQKLLPKFKEAHPGCNYSESNYSDQYSKIVIESMRDGDAEKQDKIIKRIAKEVLIDKINN